VPGDGRAEHLVAKGAATANAGYSRQAGWNGGESARGRHVDDERPKTGDKATHVTRLVPTPPDDTPSQRVPIHSVLMSGTLARCRGQNRLGTRRGMCGALKLALPCPKATALPCEADYRSTEFRIGHYRDNASGMSGH